MALIACPECGKEVSDKAPVCVHCGYPLHSNEEKVDVNQQVSDIKAKFNSFLTNPYAYKSDLAIVFSDVKHLVDNVNSALKNGSDEQKTEINNELAIIIHSAIMRGNRYSGWKTTKSYYELIDFKLLPEDIMEQMADDIIELCNYDSSMHIMLWYPISQLLSFANDDTLEEIKNCLSKKSALGIKYDDVQNMINEHLSENVSAQVMRDSITKSVDISDVQPTPSDTKPRCPTCGSTNISKISTGKKAFGFAAVGIFSSNFGKTMECKKCGYKW